MKLTREYRNKIIKRCVLARFAEGMMGIGVIEARA